MNNRSSLTNPILSIIIPTRNRNKYASETIKAILDIESNEFELIIQDNGDSNELISNIGEYASDHRLHYEHDSTLLSMGENFNKAIYRATGEFTCCMGDDDIVNTEIISICEWAKSKNLDAIIDNWRVTYYWPDFASKGELHISKFSSKAELLDAELELNRCVVSGGVGMQRLPRVYLGIVRRTCLIQTLEKIKYFQTGISPDMYLSVSIASALNRLCLLDYPVVIPGFSAAGAGWLIANKRHEGRLEDAFHLRARPTYHWPELLPRFYSVHTFFAESVWAAINATSRSDLVRKFNFPFLYIVSYILYPKHRPEVMESLSPLKKMKGGNLFAFSLYVLRNLVGVFISLTMKRIEQKQLRPGSAKMDQIIGNVSNTKQAAIMLEEYLKNTNRKFDKNRISLKDREE